MKQLLQESKDSQRKNTVIFLLNKGKVHHIQNDSGKPVSEAKTIKKKAHKNGRSTILF